MMEGHHKLEEIGETDNEIRLPRRETAQNAPHGHFQNDLHQYITLLFDKSHFRTENPNFEFQSKILPEKAESTPHG